MASRNCLPGPTWALPADLVPRWGQLPRLALVSATGVIVANLRRAHPVLAAPAAVVLLCLVLAARVSGQLAGSEHAMVIVLHRRWARARLAAVVVPVILVEVGLLFLVAVCLPGGILLFWGAFVYGGLVLAQALVFVSWRGWTHLRTWWTSGRTRRARLPAEAVELTSASAWPRRAGHGSALWIRLGPALATAGRPVIAKAADAGLAAQYARSSALANMPAGEVVGDAVLWRPAT